MQGDKSDKGGYRQINKFLNICAFEDYLEGQTSKLAPLPDVEQITPCVLRVLGQNPGRFTFQGTNVFLVGTGVDKIMVDTGGGERAWAELIEATCAGLGIRIAHVLLTHWHGDHTGGVPDLIRLYPHLKDAIYKNEPEDIQQDIRDGQVWEVQGATVRATHVPGHSSDHMCFILEEENAMFTGDNILGTGTSAVEDLGVFMDSLQKMYDSGCMIGYPAHGVTIAQLPAKIKQELNQKHRRERQVLKALKNGRERGQRSLSVREVVEDMYGNKLDESTRTLALEPFIGEVLSKLAGDGKVAFEVRQKQRKWFSLEMA